ncbi:M57 family metalloprotease [Nocardioides sp. TF02-7]|uniref:M57 family metalloprotease n=1 Tax=Nocardioides sp. TF02-7 TaxID=2917724 RepID=UPI001F059356|nr:M57 family metalloprotease [Nocardioides sp. TF02-7]UMG93399.1 M57 family metalloprotease [Nocardioides sp. TF02-7]
MFRSRVSKIFAAVSGAALAASLAGTATAGQTSTPSFKEFKASTYVDTDGQYIVNGDEPVATTGALRDFYDRMVKPRKVKKGDTSLVVNTVGGYDDKWSATQARNLTYCVSTAFAGDHAAIVDAMAGGAAIWESATSALDFRYDASQDGSCNTRNNNVLFSVEPVSTTQYIARAFFPSSPKSARNVLIDDSIWSSGSWEPVDILAHELGHALGFRHEHTRPEAGTCFEDNNWRPLTAYDDSSIMHYPQCNGGSSDLEFQASDAEGVRALYGS